MPKRINCLDEFFDELATGVLTAAASAGHQLIDNAMQSAGFTVGYPQVEQRVRRVKPRKRGNPKVIRKVEIVKALPAPKTEGEVIDAEWVDLPGELS